MEKRKQVKKCEYKYTDGTQCNRIINRPYLDHGGKHYCIFHVHADDKLQQLQQEMRNEIDVATKSFIDEIEGQHLSEDNENHKAKIAEIRSKFLLNYEGAYIPNGFDLLKNYLLCIDIVFKRGIFKGITDFDGAHFKGNVNFSFASFDGVSFQFTFFMEKVFFSNVVFGRETNFSDTSFNDDVNFRQSKFNEDLYFFSGKFEKRASFDKATFIKKVIFSDVFFNDKVDFSMATFSSDVEFQETVFNQNVNFFKSIFIGNVEYAGAMFIDNIFFTFINLDKAKLKFRNVIFFSTGAFQDISEGSNISFINCNFFSVSFLRSRISNIVFSNCSFNLTERCINNKMAEIDIPPHFLLMSSENKEKLKSILLEQKKQKIDKSKGKYKRLYKKILLAEHRQFLERQRFKILIKTISKQGLEIATYPLLRLFPNRFNSLRKIVNFINEESTLIDFGEVRDNYIQLKVNMDRMKDYDLANDFYNGEMEMKRLGEKWYKPKRWFLALYKYLSGYGNKPGQAVVMFFLCMFLLSFPLLFMKIDRILHTSQVITRVEVKWQSSLIDNFKETSSLMLYNVVALSHFAEDLYQTNDRCTIAYLFFVQYIFRPVQVALIILAIRRKVKRGEE